MTKPTQATIFRKRQILPASGLNKALQDYGSAGGSVPYKTDGTQDKSMTAPLGTKSAPFGDAYFKGMNIYSEIEVQALVSAGKLTANDRMVFWDTDTNNLAAWNGSAIVQLGGNGGGGSMDYLFGNGADGDVTMVANGNYDVVKNFKNFTLNSGVTLSRTSAGSPMIIKCTGTCTINGTINLDGKGWPAGMGYGTPVRTWRTDPGSNADVGFSESQFSSIAGLTYKNRQPSGSFDENMTYFLASVFDFGNIALMGGGGATQANPTICGYGAGSGGTGSGGNQSASAGNGGGGLIIIAKKIILNGSISCKGGAGVKGESGSGIGAARYYTAGGGGGCVILIGNEITGSGNINCAGGAGGYLYSSMHGTDGGSGGFVKVLI